jgi:hypothetical protein
MIFTEGTSVIYKDIVGVIAFTSEEYISILVNKGKHRSQDVKVIVNNYDFNKVIFADGK